MKFGIILLLLASLLIGTIALAVTYDSREIFVFTSSKVGCNFCQSATNYLTTLQQQKGSPYRLLIYDIDEKALYHDKFIYFLNAYKIKDQMVPTIFIGANAIVGFSPKEIADAYNHCQDGSCPNPEKYMLDNVNAQEVKALTQTQTAEEGSSQTYIIWVIIVLIPILGLIFIFAKKKPATPD